MIVGCDYHPGSQQNCVCEHRDRPVKRAAAKPLEDIADLMLPRENGDPFSPNGAVRHD